MTTNYVKAMFRIHNTEYMTKTRTHAEFNETKQTGMTRPGDYDDYEVSRRMSFTKESAACSAFPHQVHGPGQGARAGERPRVHASILGADAATAGAKMSGTQREEKRGYQGRK